MKPLRTHPGLRSGLVLAALWVLAWAAGLGPGRDVRWAGVSLLTWAHVAVGVLAVAVSLRAGRRLEEWEEA
ncbi:MAG TPA: hypothetical protein VEJ18_05530 [Planctomycetota bacterium]|nr:hypothetical protein [Planctomycetota bacterium]